MHTDQSSAVSWSTTLSDCLVRQSVMWLDSDYIKNCYHNSQWIKSPWYDRDPFHLCTLYTCSVWGIHCCNGVCLSSQTMLPLVHDSPTLCYRHCWCYWESCPHYRWEQCLMVAGVSFDLMSYQWCDMWICDLLLYSACIHRHESNEVWG